MKNNNFSIAQELFLLIAQGKEDSQSNFFFPFWQSIIFNKEQIEIFLANYFYYAITFSNCAKSRALLNSFSNRLLDRVDSPIIPLNFNYLSLVNKTSLQLEKFNQSINLDPLEILGANLAKSIINDINIEAIKIGYLNNYSYLFDSNSHMYDTTAYFANNMWNELPKFNEKIEVTKEEFEKVKQGFNKIIIYNQQFWLVLYKSVIKYS